MYFRDFFNSDFDQPKEPNIVHLLVAPKFFFTSNGVSTYFFKHWIFRFLSQIEISNVGFPLFLILTDLFIKLDSKININDFYFCFFWLYRKKVYLLWREHAFLFSNWVCHFLTKVEIFNVCFYFYFFLYCRDLLFNYNSFQWKNFFVHFSVVPIKKFTSGGAS